MEEVEGRELIKPAENYGVKMLSIGFFVNKNDAVYGVEQWLATH